MRKLESHKVNPANEQLGIEALGIIGAGGADCRYDITGFDTAGNPASVNTYGYKTSFTRIPIIFQNGTIAETGVNGITHEVLIAILIDRLEAFQNGPFSNNYNQLALEHLKIARAALRARTRERISRGIEGTHAK